MSENLIWQSKTERSRSFEELQLAARDTLRLYAGWRRDQERPNEQAIQSRVKLAPPVGALAAEVFERLTGAGMAEDQATTVAAETAAAVMVRRQAGAPEQADMVIDASAELIDQVAHGRDESVALADFREAIVGWRGDGDSGGRFRQPVLVTFPDGTVVPDGAEVVPGIRETGPRHSIVAPQVETGIDAYLTARGEGLDIHDALDRASTSPGVREAVSEFADDVELYGTDIDTARTAAVAGTVADAALGQFQSLRNAGVDADHAAVTAAGGDPVALHAIGGFIARVRDGFPEDIADPDAWAAAVTAVHSGERYQGGIPDGVELPGFHFSRDFAQRAIETHTPGESPEDREGIDVEAVRRYEWLTRHGMDPGAATRLAAVDTAAYRAQRQAREESDAIAAAEAVIQNVGSDLDLARAVEEDGDGFEPDVPHPVVAEAEQLALDHNHDVAVSAVELFEKCRRYGRNEAEAHEDVLNAAAAEDRAVADTALGHYHEYRRDGFDAHTAAGLAADVAADELTPEFGHEPTVDDRDADTATGENQDVMEQDWAKLTQAATRLAAERYRDIAFLRSTAAAGATDPVVRARLEREAREATAAADGYAARAAELADGNEPWEEVEIAEQVERARVAATHDVLDNPSETSEQLRRREIADATVLSYLTWQQEGIPPEEIAHRLERVSPIGAKAVSDYEQLITIGYDPDDARAMAADTATQDPIPSGGSDDDPDELMPAGDAMQNYFVADDAVGRFARLRAAGWDDEAAMARAAVEASSEETGLAVAAVMAYRRQLDAGQSHDEARSAAVSDVATEFTPRISAEQASQVRATLAHPAAAQTAPQETGNESTVENDELGNSAPDTGPREDNVIAVWDDVEPGPLATVALHSLSARFLRPGDRFEWNGEIYTADDAAVEHDGMVTVPLELSDGSNAWVDVPATAMVPLHHDEVPVAHALGAPEVNDPTSFRTTNSTSTERGAEHPSAVSTGSINESDLDHADTDEEVAWNPVAGEQDVDDSQIAAMPPTSSLPEREPERSWIARNLPSHTTTQADEDEDEDGLAQHQAELRAEREYITALATELEIEQARDILRSAEELGQHLAGCNLEVSQCSTCSVQEQDSSGNFWTYDVPAARVRLAHRDTGDESTVETNEPGTFAQAEAAATRRRNDEELYQSQVQQRYQALLRDGVDMVTALRRAEEAAGELWQSEPWSAVIPRETRPAADTADEMVSESTTFTLFAPGDVVRSRTTGELSTVTGAAEVWDPAFYAPADEIEVPEVPERAPEPGSWIARNLPARGSTANAWPAVDQDETTDVTAETTSSSDWEEMERVRDVVRSLPDGPITDDDLARVGVTGEQYDRLMIEERTFEADRAPEPGSWIARNLPARAVEPPEADVADGRGTFMLPVSDEDSADRWDDLRESGDDLPVDPVRERDAGDRLQDWIEEREDELEADERDATEYVLDGIDDVLAEERGYALMEQERARRENAARAADTDENSEPSWLTDPDTESRLAGILDRYDSMRAECARLLKDAEARMRRGDDAEDTERAERCARWNAEDEAVAESVDDETEGWEQR